jgi:hypothetical protein
MAMNFKIRCRLSPVLFLELVEFPNAYALSRVNFIGGGWIPAWVLVPFVFDLGVDCRWFNHAPPDRDDSPIPSDGTPAPLACATEDAALLAGTDHSTSPTRQMIKLRVADLTILPPNLVRMLPYQATEIAHTTHH